jgi:hypothetical protein
LEFALTVGDGETTSAEDRVVVTVAAPPPPPPPPNAAPVATVEPATLESPRRAFVRLSGWAWDANADRLTYAWRQTAGVTVALADANTPAPSFVAPENAGVLRFEFVANDGRLQSAPAVATVTVRNYAPQILSLELAPDEPRTANDIEATVTTADADGDALTVAYAWSVNGVPVPGQTSRTLPASAQRKGDVVSVRATASDGSLDVTQEASTTIRDTPPVISATPPSVVPYDTDVTFQMNATDADGDPIPPFRLRYGPAGFAVSPTGTVTWRPRGAMFDNRVENRWSVSLAGHDDSPYDATLQVTDPSREYALRRTGIEIPVQHDGLVVTDLDGDGDTEILVASPRTLYTLEKRGSGYVQTWAHPYAIALPTATYGAANVEAVAAADAGTDGKQEIYVAAGDTLVVLDGATRREIARRTGTPGGMDRCVFLEVADLDRDGDRELVCIAASDGWQGNGRILVLDPLTLGVEWSTPTGVIGGAGAVGNVDADPALEIVTAAGYVYDGATRANQWAYGPGFGSFVDTGDLDGDQIEEIVGGVDWTAVRVYGAVARSPLYEVTTSDIDTLRVVDIDGNGRAEILVGDGQWGKVTAYAHSATPPRLVEVFAINSQEHGVTSIATGDVDGDGALEFVWGSGASSSGADRLVVAGRNPTIAVEWMNDDPQQLDATLIGAAIATIAPGQRRLLYASPSSNSGYGGMRLVALDPASGNFRISGEIGSNWSGNRALTAADYDGDGIDEALLASASTYDGFFAAYDFDRGVTEWTSPQGIGSGVAVTTSDLSGDGRPDLVGITAGGKVYAFDVAQQSILWQSTTLDGGRDVAIADLDGDGRREIVALTSTRVVVYRTTSTAANYLEGASVALADGIDLVVADLDGDSRPEVVVLSGSFFAYSTRLTVLDQALAVRADHALSQPASAVAVEPSNALRKNLLVAFGDPSGSWFTSAAPFVGAVDPVEGELVWASPALAGNVQRNSISHGDLLQNGGTHLALGTNAGMFVTR